MRKNRSLEPLAIFQNWIKIWCVNFPVISCHFSCIVDLKRFKCNFPLFGKTFCFNKFFIVLFKLLFVRNVDDWGGGTGSREIYGAPKSSNYIQAYLWNGTHGIIWDDKFYGTGLTKFFLFFWDGQDGRKKIQIFFRWVGWDKKITQIFLDGRTDGPVPGLMVFFIFWDGREGTQFIISI
jgi:hypothetical protein